MKNVMNAFKRIDWKSYYLFLLFPIFPLFYQIVLRTNIYSQTSHLLEEAHHFNLHYNLKWIMFGFVVLSEVLFFPLIYMFGKELKKKNFAELENKLKGFLIIAVAVYTVVVAALIPLIPNLLDNANAEVIAFIRLEIISLALLSIAQILMLVFQIADRRKILYFFAVYCISTLLFDVIIFNQDTLHVGLVNVNIIVSYLIIIVMAIIFLRKKFDINIFSKKKINFHFMHQYLHLAEHALIDAVLIDMAMILFIGNFGHNLEFDIFYTLLILNLTIPVTALTILCRSEFSLLEDHKAIRGKVKDYLMVASVISFVWIGALLLLFELSSGEHLGEWLIIVNADDFKKTLLCLAIFIFLRSVKSVISATFYGLGELGILTTIAIWTTVIVYLPAYIYAKENNTVFSLDTMIIIIALVIVVDAILTVLLYRRMLKKYESGHGGIEHHSNNFHQEVGHH